MKYYCNHYVCEYLTCPFHIAHSAYADGMYRVVECKCPKEVSYTSGSNSYGEQIQTNRTDCPWKQVVTDDNDCERNV